MEVSSISAHIDNVAKKEKGAPAFLPDLTRQTSEQVFHPSRLCSTLASGWLSSRLRKRSFGLLMFRFLYFRGLLFCRGCIWCWVDGSKDCSQVGQCDEDYA
eukprot:1353222-Amorphochlora_amoeboformis.AAC.1